MNSKEEQFNRMVNTHKRTIYSVCYMFSNQPYEVEELFQETLIRLWTGFENFAGRSKERTWVYRVALNTAINLHKSKKRRVDTVPLTFDIEALDDESKSLQAHQLHDIIARLDPMDKALVLLWLDDMSYADIGAIMGITPTNVGSRLMRAKEKLIELSKKSH
ncbi:MAG: RNA polymerase sigma factor [Bacteroidales bacterium]|nr:RNA polymerase sigma factor [Bacteroidales bacterium]